jgi:hypothetical protein
MIENTPLSAAKHDWLVAAAQRSHRTVEAMPVIIEAVERAEMDPKHVSLDELLN